MEIKLKKYDSYKDSGVEWLGEIPEGWKISKLGVILTPVSENNRVDLPLLSITREKGVILRDLENETENHNFIPDDLSNYKVLRKGQFGMNKMKAWQGSYGISQYDGIVSPAYFIFNLRTDVHAKYFHYAIRSKLFISFFGSASDGVRIGQWDLSKARMREIPFLVPHLQEQTAIANFLDKKSALIEQAIAIKEKQIELLKERRQILIHQAVTKGLDKNSKLKDSGVEWIGEIPEGWEVKALKYIARLQSGETISSEKFTEEGYPVFGGNGFRGYTDRFTNEGEFILIGRQGALCGNVNFAKGQFFASEHAIVVYIINNESLIWLGEAIKIADFNRLSQSAAQPGIAVNVIKNILFPYPSKTEQEQISKYIENVSNKISNTISLKEKEIEKLKEYKASLINSAVTGKIKVYN
ncbi:restriction endonuclease subunit S [Pedobacter glucosidilyticus]|uniref:restriction endonuclease subunit S n=1 Tax=Pedobacter glucosidilyticus TaxID=1122941 RepID=UPI0026F2FDE0|nr:restriction endonuclease subunit S [Pedobacter glucosidilyticus]